MQGTVKLLCNKYLSLRNSVITDKHKAPNFYDISYPI